jgi:hypothetical protein
MSRTWPAQLVVIAGLVMAFAIPYAGCRVLAARSDERWARSGLSADEIQEWRDHGFDDVQEAIRWRNARFQAPGALLWAEEGWDDAGEAARWKDVDFGSREARRWREQGFAAEQARSWRDADFLPQDARQWSEACVNPPEARARRNRGEDPDSRGGECER